MKNASQSTSAETAPPSRRRRLLWLCALVWTVFVGLTLWWSLQGNAGPTVWIVREAASPQTGTAGGIRTFVKTEVGLQRVYPWVLLGPYAALLAWFFPLERGRLRLSLPINLAVCVGFIAASQAINARTRIMFARVTVMNSEAAQGVGRTNTIQVQITSVAPGDLLREQITGGPVLNRFADQPMPGAVATSGRHPAVSDAGLTNLLDQLQRRFNLHPPPSRGQKLSLWSVLLDLLAYVAILGLAHSVHFNRRFRERERRALVLESNFAKARLGALRAQLQPHLLFNGLNAVATLLRRDPRLAEATLMSLSELLRLALSQSERQEVALREEMEFVQRYLEIQQTRFGDRLRVEQDIEPAALDCLVPTLALQPLIENAIRHGIEPAETAGLLRLTAQRQDAKLVLTVEDDGVGLPASDVDATETTAERTNPTPGAFATSSSAPVVGGGTGIGLKNLRARLKTLYGTRHKLELTPRPEGGVTVRLEIPWHPVAASEVATARNS